MSILQYMAQSAGLTRHCWKSFLNKQAHLCISCVRANKLYIPIPLSLSLYRYSFIPISLSLSLYPYSFIPIPLSLFLSLSIYPYKIIPITLSLSFYYYCFIPIPFSLSLYPYPSHNSCGNISCIIPLYKGCGNDVCYFHDRVQESQHSFYGWIIQLVSLLMEQNSFNYLLYFMF